jgi:hypothetical protein
MCRHAIDKKMWFQMRIFFLEIDQPETRIALID